MSRPNPEERYKNYPWRYVSYDPNGNVIVPDNTTINRLQFKRAYISTSTPGFPKVKRNNAHFSYINKFSSQVGTFQDTNVSNGYYSIATFGMDYGQIGLTPSDCPYSVVGVSHDPRALRMATDGAMDEVKDQKINFAQFIAERKQVVDMVNDTVNRLTKAIKAVRRRDFSGASRALGLTSNPSGLSRSVSSNWLAYQYGWKPLLSDVKGAAEHLARNSFEKPIRIRVKRQKTLESPALTWLAGNGWGGKMTVKFSSRRTTAHIGLTFKVTNDITRESQQLGITDPLTLAWELLPYSFVVDWFLPVGNFLQRLNYDSGLSFESGYTVQLTTQSGIAQNQNDLWWIDGYTKRQFNGTGAVVWEHTAFDRAVLSDPPQAVFPSFKDPFSATHVLNALALMRVAFGR